MHLGKQLDLYNDYIAPQWNDSELDVCNMESWVLANVIAYAPLYHYLRTEEIMSYHLIIKETGRNPYHFGGTGQNTTTINKEPVPRDFQLLSKKLWTLEWIIENQRGRWFWKSDADHNDFQDWYDKKFK